MLPFFLFFSPPPPPLASRVPSTNPSSSLPSFSFFFQIFPTQGWGSFFAIVTSGLEGEGGKGERRRGGGGGQVSQGARGQLIVSGNVFHLHVYTVNSGRGLSTAPFTAAIPIRVGNCVEQPKQTPYSPDGFFSVGRDGEKCCAVQSC